MHSELFDYQKWLSADHDTARQLLSLAPDQYLTSEPAHKFKVK